MKMLFKKPYVIVIAFWSILIAFGFVFRGKISGEKFDSQKWKTADMNSEENWFLRWDMMNSLRNSHNLVGMSKNDIIKLLGKPSESSKENIFRYGLGYTHTGINTGTLSIIFVNGIVTEINVWEG